MAYLSLTCFYVQKGRFFKSVVWQFFFNYSLGCILSHFIKITSSIWMWIFMVICIIPSGGNRTGVVNKHMWQQRDTYFNHECFCNKYFINFHTLWNKMLHRENDKSWFYHTSWLKIVSMVFYLSYLEPCF